MEELQDSLVTPLVLLHNFWVIQVASRCHPSVNLGAERLNILDLPGQALFKGRDILWLLILACQHHVWDLDLRSIVGANSGRVNLHAHSPGSIVARGERDDLPAPACSVANPLRDLWLLLLDLIKELKSVLGTSEEVAASLEPGTEQGAGFFSWWVPRLRGWLAVEEVGDVNTVVGWGRREDVGALKGLRVESENIVAEDNAGGCGGRANDV